MQGQGRFELQFDRRRLLQAGEPVVLGSRAYDLLVALWERRTRVVEKSELLELVWPGLVVEENNLQVQIGHLRKVLGADAIATVPGRGYRFTGDLAAAGSRPLPGDEPGASTEGPLPQLLALIRDIEAELSGPIDLRTLGESIAACRRLVWSDRLALGRLREREAGRSPPPLDIDDVRAALGATRAALGLRIAASGLPSHARLSSHVASDTLREPTGPPAGVQPPWE